MPADERIVARSARKQSSFRAKKPAAWVSPCGAGLLSVGALTLLVACQPDQNFLGTNGRLSSHDAAVVSVTLDAAAEAGVPSLTTAPVPTPAQSSSPIPSVSVTSAASSASDAGIVSDTGTLDGGNPIQVRNYFVDVLELTPEVVDTRLEDAYHQLFHGGSNEDIYIEASDTEAYVYDVYHMDTRMDASGYGMLVSVLLGHKEEFDKIWRYTKRRMLFTTGAKAGYFSLTCPLDESVSCSDAVSSYGISYVVTALLVAESRWGNETADDLNYGAAAVDSLQHMRSQEELNGGVVEDVLNIFDNTTYLPNQFPEVGMQDRTEPGAILPAFFEMWGRRTGDEFWLTAADEGRALLHLAMHPDTGLAPALVGPDGSVITGEESFKEGSFGVAFNLALDYDWYAADAGQPELANRVVQFFAPLSAPYSGSYRYDTGDQTGTFTSVALTALTEAAATMVTEVPGNDPTMAANQQKRLIQRFWDRATPSGPARYFDGAQTLLVLTYLSGKLLPY